MKSKKVKIAAVLAGTVLLAVLVLPYAVNIDSLRPRLEASLQSHLGREVHIGHLELSLLAGGARAENFSIADDPAFSSRPFLRAKSLNVGVSLFSLIFSRSLHVTSLAIEEPELVLAKSSSGKWNFSALGSAAVASDYDGAGSEDLRDDALQSVSPSSFLLDRLNIANATLVLPGSRGSSAGNVLKNIDIDLRNASFDGVMSFSVSTHSDAGRIEVRGQAGPINRKNPEQTPFHATLKGDKADLAQIARLNSSAGLSGILGLDASVTSDGRWLHSEGTAHAENLRLNGSGTGSRRPVSLRYATDYSFARHAGSLNDCEISVRKSSARLGGTYQLRGDSLIAHLRLAASQLPLDDVEGVFPALGIQLPGGSKLHGGTVGANLAVDGPFARLVTTGTAQVANAHLSGFDLGSKLSSIPALGGISSGSEVGIVALSSGFRIAPQGIHISNFNSQFSGIGTLSGDGDIDASNNLKFSMAAHLASGGLLRSGFDHVGLKGVPDDIPFLVVGTTSTPIFLPDLGGMAKRAARSATKQAAQQAVQKAWPGNSGKSLTSVKAAFAPRPESGEAAPEASASEKHSFLHGMFHWHKQKKQNHETELAKK
jgi:AsmA protein